MGGMAIDPLPSLPAGGLSIQPHPIRGRRAVVATGL